MKITDIRLRKIMMNGKLRAIVSVTFDDAFVVHEIKVIKGYNGFFVAMPSVRAADGTYKDIVHPICTSMRAEIQSAVLDAYLEQIVMIEQEMEPPSALAGQ